MEVLPYSGHACNCCFILQFRKMNHVHRPLTNLSSLLIQTAGQWAFSPVSQNGYDVQDSWAGICRCDTDETRCRHNGTYVTVLVRHAVSVARPPTRPARRRPTAHAPGGWPARPLAALQTTTMTDDRRQRAKQYWTISRASNKIQSETAGFARVPVHHMKNMTS